MKSGLFLGMMGVIVGLLVQESAALQFVTTNLPAAVELVPYRTRLEATNGQPPYVWSLVRGNYEETIARSGTFSTGGVVLSAGTQRLTLPFRFPFFGSIYTQCWVNANGALHLDRPSDTPSFSQYTTQAVIGVLWASLATESGAVSVEESGATVTVRWVGRYSLGGAVNVSVSLSADGRIACRYGAGNLNGGWIGISAGNGREFLVSSRSQTGSMANAGEIEFRRTLPKDLRLSADGVLDGTMETTGTYVVHAEALDGNSVRAQRDLVLAVAANPDQRPQIQSRNPAEAQQVLPEGTNQLFEVQALDPEGSNVTYRWTLDGQVRLEGVNSNQYRLVTAWGDAGLKRLSCLVSDGLWTSQVYTVWQIQVLSDNDGDGLPNAFERLNGLDPWIAADALADADNDFLNNLEEYRNATGVRNRDTDGDGLPDGWEMRYGSNPLKAPKISSAAVFRRLGGWQLPNMGAARSICVVGSYAYVAAGGGGLRIYDLRNPALPVLVGSLDTDGEAQGVFVSGRYAYVADGPNGLVIVSVSVATSPYFVSRHGTAGSAAAVWVSGTLAYVAAATGGMEIVDVAKPGLPVRLAVAEVDAGAAVRDVQVIGNHAFAAVSGSTLGALHVFDVSTSAVPWRVAAIGPGSAVQLCAETNRLYLAKGAAAGVDIVDISVPALPVVQGSFSGGLNQPVRVQDVAVEDGLVFAVGTLSQGAGFVPTADLVDAANPANPSRVGSIATGLAQPAAVAKVGRYLYIADLQTGLQVVDLQDGRTPMWTLGLPTRSEMVDVTLDSGRNYAYVSDLYGGLHILDVRTMSSPKRVGGYYDGAAVHEAAIRDRYAYVAAGTNGLVTLDIFQPKTPVFLSRQAGLGELASLALDPVQGLIFAGQLSGEAPSGLLHAFTLGTPSTPRSAQSYQALGSMEDVVWTGGIACLAHGITGVEIVAAPDAATPMLRVGSLGLSGPVRQVQSLGGRVYAASGEAGLQIVDVARPQQPAVLGGYAINGATVLGVDVDGTNAYLAAGAQGLWIVTVDRPAEPELAGHYAAFPAVRIARGKNRSLFLAGGSNGLEIVDFSTTGDGDRLPDEWELLYFGHLGYDENSDLDRDGLSNGIEYSGGFDPRNPDEDSDGVPDGQEVLALGISPKLADSDGDGVGDGEEVNPGLDGYVSNPLVVDTDADGLSDGVEFDLNRDPSTPESGTGMLRGSITAAGAGLGGVRIVLIGGRSGQVYADGSSVSGSGDYQVQPAAAGSYRVKVEAAGFQDEWYPGVELSAEAVSLRIGVSQVVQDVDFELSPGQGQAQVEVRSDPAGAEVFVDLQPTGLLTPVVLDVGEVQGATDTLAHRIGVRKAGTAQTGPVEVFAVESDKVRVDFDLRPAPGGALSVQTFPAGASVYVDTAESAVGMTPVVVTNLQAGQHWVLLEQPGYFRPRPIVATVGSVGSTVTVSVTLAPLGSGYNAEVQVRSVPADARVYADYRPDTHYTDCTVSDLSLGAPSGAGWSSAPHRILVRKTGYKRPAPVRVADGQNPPTIRFALLKAAFGTPDGWRARYFPTGVNQGDLDDPDADGYSNFREYVAGTDPTQANGNTFSIQAMSPVRAGDTQGVSAVTGFGISWEGRPDRRYDVQWKPDMQSAFQSLEAGIAATPPLNVRTSRVGILRSGFYRVGVRLAE